MYGAPRVEATAEAAGPYVGLRPFEAHERRLLHGRDRDARRLCDRVLSSPVTLLYAQSGLGKTSLLRSLVAPDLEAEDCRVVYFDAWTGEEPERALKAPLLAACRSLGLPAPSDDPSLLDLFRLLASADGKAQVLLLDQFEEFLLAHGQRLDPLRRELASLVRASDLDVHVLIALREEFLAALEPFRSSILGLFQSAYRLEALDEEGGRRAIVEPARAFGRAVEPGLAERLLRDLRPGGEEGRDRASGELDLPMLQLVCSELWRAADALSAEALREADYDWLGGADRILAGYVSGVMPRAGKAQIFTARLMRQLAPPSGYKVSYSPADLAALTGLRLAPIEAELRRLAERRILRAREFRSGGRYELQHDAFIRILAPWRDAVLRRARTRRRAGWGLAAAVSAAAIAGLLAFGERRLREEELFRATEGALLAIGETPEFDRARIAELTFDQVAGRLLWREQDYERLRRVLIAHESLMPDGYGLRKVGEGYVAQASGARGVDWPFQLTISSLRGLDDWVFARDWEAMAQGLAKTWGVPAPLRLSVRRSSTLPVRLVRAIGPEGAAADLEVEAYEDAAIVTSRGLPGPAAEFFERHKADWAPRPALQHGGPWWGVPKWSLPVWKVSGHTATSGSGVTPVLVANAFLRNPEPLLNPATVRLMLRALEAERPDTVREALSARGERLPRDLAELVKLGAPLTNLPLLLDALAELPQESSAEAASAAFGGRSAGPRLLGAWPQRTEKEPLEPEESVKRAFAQIEPWLVSSQRPVRVWLGSEVERPLVRGGQLTDELREAVDGLRDEIFRVSGVDAPPVHFKDSDDEDAQVGASQLRIEILDQAKGDAEAAPIEAGGNPLGATVGELRARLFDSRRWWITAEATAAALAQLRPELRAWLEARYSVTDLKRLLRATLGGRGVGEGVLASAPGPAPDLGWLLESLVFWAGAETTGDVEELAGRLKAMLRARAATPAASDRIELAAELADGFSAQAEGRYEEASERFSAARASQPAAADEFLRQMAQEAALRAAERVRTTCSNLGEVVAPRPRRLEIEDALASASVDQRRRLRLCLAQAHSVDLGSTRSAALMQALLAAGDGAPERWAAPDAAAFGLALLRRIDRLAPAAEALAPARVLLGDALKRLDEAAAADLFVRVVRHCEAFGALLWCRRLTEELASAAGRRDVHLEHAWTLAGRERRDDMESALAHARAAERLLAASGLPEADRVRKADFIRYIRGLVNTQLAALGEARRLLEAEAAFGALLESKAVGRSAHGSLISLYVRSERFVEAQRILDEARRRWPGDAGLTGEAFWLDLARQAPNLASHAAALAERTDEQGMFEAALAEILSGADPWRRSARKFLDAEHPYRNYVAAILYAFEPEERRSDSHALLEAYAAGVDSRSWPARLDQGDAGVWREMLIAYYLGRLERERLFAPLESDEAFAASAFLHLPLPRIGMLCEAHFYDALLARSKGDMQNMREALQRVLATGYLPYTEFSMAKYLLRR